MSALLLFFVVLAACTIAVTGLGTNAFAGQADASRTKIGKHFDGSLSTAPNVFLDSDQRPDHTFEKVNVMLFFSTSVHPLHVVLFMI